MTLADIALATVAVAFTGHVTDDFFLFFFLTLMIAGISGQFGLTIVATTVVCLVYVGVLYTQQEAALWRREPARWVTTSRARAPVSMGRFW